MTDRINGYGPFTPINVSASTAPFTTDEIRAAEIEAAREEGRRAGLMEAAQMVRSLPHPVSHNVIQRSLVSMAKFATDRAAAAIEAKAKEAGR